MAHSPTSCGFNKTFTLPSNLKVLKRDGATEIAGHLYEIYMCMLMLLKKEEVRVHDIYLTTNAKLGADFDDVILKIVYADNEEVQSSRVFFVQTKHKKNPRKASRISHQLLLSDSKDFSLRKYFISYRTVRENFKRAKPDDPIFSSSFCDCEFVLYTNLLPNERFGSDENVRRVAVAWDHFLNFREENSYYQLCGTREIYQTLREGLQDEPVVDEEIDEFLRQFKLFIDQPNRDQLETIIKCKLESMYKITPNNTTNVFSEVEYKVRNWWETGDFYLRKDNTYFEDSARVKIFNVKAPVESFTGRNRELSRLHEILQHHQSKPTVISQMTTICGLGGIGKTELARKYAHDYCAYHDNNVIWINADSEESLKESFVTLAKDQLLITTKDSDGKDKTITSIVAEIYNFFSRRDRKCLFIFDNADRNRFLYRFLPMHCLNPEDVKPSILITSRNQVWERGIEVLPLDEFEQEEAENFLRIALDHPDAAITELVTKLQRFPLALQQAAAYINYEKAQFDEEYTVSDYLKQYDTQTPELLDYDGFQGVDNQYTQTTFTTWKITIEKIRNDAEWGVLASSIFYVIAYCAPEGIPIRMFLSFTKGDETQLKRVIHIIAKYSLIKIDKKIISVHRLVQEVARLTLRNIKTVQYNALNTLLIILSANNISAETLDHALSAWKYAQEFTDFILNYVVLWEQVIFVLNKKNMPNEALSIAETMGRLIKDRDDIPAALNIKLHSLSLLPLLWLDRIEEAFRRFTDLLKWSERNALESGNSSVEPIKYTFCRLLADVEDYDNAADVIKVIIKEEVDLLGPDHLETLLVQEKLANLMSEHGNYGEAMNLLREVVGIETKILGDNHTHVLEAQQGYAVLLAIQGNHKESMELLRTLFERCTIVLGPYNPRTLSTQFHIASVLSEQGKLNEALVQFTDVLEKRIKVLGKHHYDTLRTRLSTVEILSQLGYHSEVKEYSKTILEGQIKLLGEEHPYSLVAQLDFANVLMNEGDYHQAIDTYNEILENQIKIHGKDNVETLRTQHITAYLLFKQGNYEEAMEMYTNVLERQIKLLRDEHPETLSTHNSIACALEDQGKFSEALIKYKEISEIQTRALGGEHRDTLETQFVIAKLLDKLGKHEEAQEVLEKTWKLQINLLGAEHQDTLFTQDNLAVQLAKQGKREEALNIWSKLFETQTRTLGKDHNYTMETQRILASTLSAQYKCVEAAELFEDILNQQSRTLSDENPELLQTRSNLADVYLKQGKHADAMKNCKEILEKQIRVLGRYHENTLSTRFLIACVTSYRGNYEKALQIYEEILEQYIKSFGEENLDTLQVRHNIANILSEQGKYDDAIKIFNEVFQLQTRILGEDNDEVLLTQHSMAEALSKQGKYDEAMEIFSNIFGKQTELCGEEHPMTLLMRWNMANVLFQQGAYVAAEETLTEILEKQIRIMGCDHKDTLRTQHSIAELLAKQGKRREAMDLFKEVLEKQIRFLGEDHPDTRLTRYNMNSLLPKLDKAVNWKRLLTCLGVAANSLFGVVCYIVKGYYEM